MSFSDREYLKLAKFYITEKTGSSPKHLPATENNTENNNLDQKLLW